MAGGASVESGFEVLDAGARALERRYLGLRTTDGLALDEVPPGTCNAWYSAGWAAPDGDRIRLTIEGWLRLDALVAAASHS